MMYRIEYEYPATNQALGREVRLFEFVDGAENSEEALSEFLDRVKGIPIIFRGIKEIVQQTELRTKVVSMTEFEAAMKEEYLPAMTKLLEQKHRF